MSAVRAKKSRTAPTFRTSEYVDINIDPEDLEAAGWVYVGKDGEAPVPTATAVDVVRNWHDETHDIPWRWCQDEPCHSLNREHPVALS